MNKNESVNISLSLKDKAILSKVRYASIEPIPLTEKWLNKLEFEKNTEYKFNSYQLHPYWAQNGVILFYNTGQEEYAYLCGYAEQRMGKYYAVGARWIKSVHELQNLYFALTGVELQLSST
jgi:DNA-binding GntR family transcriptional regulator